MIDVIGVIERERRNLRRASAVLALGVTVSLSLVFFLMMPDPSTSPLSTDPTLF